MSKFFEQKLVINCSNTLAGIKSGTVFNIKLDKMSKNALLRQIKEANSLLNSKDLYVELLDMNDTVAIIYVYRSRKIFSDLDDLTAKKVLEQYNYPQDKMACIKHLKTRFKCGKGFPDEIGLFLGFPADDVLAYIANKGQNYLYCGYWKCYQNVEESLKTFEKYKKCYALYSKAYKLGYGAMALTL